MRYYKVIEDGCVLSIGTGAGGAEIPKEEYESILSVIRNRPVVETGFAYRLKTDLTWELYELPPVEEVEQEATMEDYAAALRDMGVEV